MTTMQTRFERDPHFLTDVADQTRRLQWVFRVALWIILATNQVLISLPVAGAESDSETAPPYIPPYMRTPEFPGRRVLSPVPAKPACPPLDGVATAIGRGNAYVHRGQYQCAVEEYGNAIEASPGDDTAYYNRGAAHARLGQYQQAITDYDDAIRINPSEARAYTMRAHAYALSGQKERAFRDYNEALRLDPHSAVAYDARGVTYATQGQYARAIEDYRRALALDSCSTDVAMRLATAYLQLGQPEYANWARQKAQASQCPPVVIPNGWVHYTGFGPYKFEIKDHAAQSHVTVPLPDDSIGPPPAYARSWDDLRNP